MDKMTPEYKVTHEKLKAIMKDSVLPEMQKYALLSTCMAEIANEYNSSNFAAIKVKLALVCKTMLDAVEKADQLYSKLKK